MNNIIIYIKQFLHKVRNIIIGWYRRVLKRRPSWAKERYRICMQCPYKEKLMGEYWCSVCGCNCLAKSLVEDEQCYKNRW